MTKLRFIVNVDPGLSSDGILDIEEHIGNIIDSALRLPGFGSLDAVVVDAKETSVELAIKLNEDPLGLGDKTTWPTRLQLAASVIETVATRDVEAENYSRVLNEVINKLLELPVATLRMVDAE